MADALGTLAIGEFAVQLDGLNNYIEIFKELKAFTNPTVDLTLCIDPIIKEIEASDIIDSLSILQYIDLPDFNIVLDLLNSKLILRISEFKQLVLDGISKRDINGILQLLGKTVKMQYSLGEDFDIILSSCCDYLIDKYRLNDPDHRVQEASENLLTIINQLIGLPRSVNHILNKKRETIEKGFDIQSLTHNIYQFYRLIPKLKENKLLHCIKKKNYIVRVFKEIFPEDNLPFAVKVYSDVAKSAFKRIEAETKILAFLSEKSTASNCYLKIYGFELINNSLRIFMEYCEYDLHTLITYWREANIKLSQVDLFKCARVLLQSFAELKEFNIHHRDIKPSNILVDRLLNFKIIDFSISSKNPEEEDGQTNRAEGTANYMAPEVLEIWHSSSKKGIYSMQKADVFSLGLVLYEVSTLKSIVGLNRRENNPSLIDSIMEVDIPLQMKTLLLGMLKADYHQRKRFKYLVGILDSPGTQTTTE